MEGFLLLYESRLRLQKFSVKSFSRNFFREIDFQKTNQKKTNILVYISITISIIYQCVLLLSLLILHFSVNNKIGWIYFFRQIAMFINFPVAI